MCRNIGSSPQLGNVISSLPSLVISHRSSNEFDVISDKINNLNISQESDNSVKSRNSVSSGGDFSWQHGSTSSGSDFYIRSETGSDSSFTDDLDSESAQRLWEEFENFESSLYNDSPYSGLTETVLKESRLLALHSPQLRINATTCRVHEGVVETEQNNLNDEKDFSEEIFVSHGLFPNADTDELSEDSDSSDETASEAEEGEKLNEETCEKLFNDIWPSIVKQLNPFFEQVIKSKHNDEEKNCLELSEAELRYAIEYEKKLSGARNLSVSQLSFRSKSSRDQYQCSSSSRLVVTNENIPIRTFSKSSNAVDRKRRIAKLHTAVILPPTISLSLNKDKKVNRKQALSAKLDKTSSIVCQVDYRSKIELKPAIIRPNKIRHGLLPPIENHDVGSKIENTRSNSAMIRCRTTSSQPQRLASRNRTLLAPIELKKPILSQNKHKASNVKEEQTEPYDRSQHPVDLRQGRHVKPIPWK